MYIKEITKIIKEAAQATNGISWIEFRHFQVFTTTQSAARASLNRYVRPSSYIVRRRVTALCKIPKHLTTVYRQNNRMKSTTSQTSSPSVDLYDQDRYSIPDDELSSVSSSINTSVDGATTASMETDENTSQASSGSGSAVAKKPKVTQPPSNSFDPHKHGMESLHGRNMPDVQKACLQMADDVSITSSAYRRRVPLTTLATAEDFPSADILQRQTNDLTQTEDTSGEKSKLHRSTHTSSLKLAVSSSQDSNTSQSSDLSYAKSTKKPNSSNVASNRSELRSTTSQLATPVLPSSSKIAELSSTTFFTYRAQLTFGLSTHPDGVNVAKYFRRWIYSCSESIDNFTLVPYEDEKGIQISSLDQVPEDNADFYTTYYHNHRVLNHGNLTGMVQFQCSTPWARIKSPNHPFFNWLRLNKVYLNQTKFKTSSLVPCGFLLGAHPGHMRRDEAESELGVSLGFPVNEELPFQLSSRSVSVPVQDGKSERFAFQAVVVETSTQQAASLRERFFSLGDPKQVQQKFPYTGRYQFVPFLKTKEWTVQKILSLARLHVKIVQDLRPIFLSNLQDIHNSIDNGGTTLMQGFYGMQYTLPLGDAPPEPEPLLHSIHNTGKQYTKVALVPTCHYDSALTQLSAIHSILTSYISNEYLDRVFVGSMQAGITGQQIDSVSSCNSAAYATELLKQYNPQDGVDLPEVTPTKRFRQVPLSYAAAAGKDITADTPTDTSKATVSSVTSADLDNLFDKMKKYVAGSTNTTGINIEELELRFSKSTQEIQAVREQLSTTVSSLTDRVEVLAAELKTQNAKLSDDIQRQNVVILGMQQQFQNSLADFSTKLQHLYSTAGDKPTTVTPSAPTRNQGPWGTREK